MLDGQGDISHTQNEGGDEDDEGESVYMIDGVVMRMIQIEGEDNQYLMDPQGRIYDMQANFIGTANTQGLEEMAPDDNANETGGELQKENFGNEQVVDDQQW